MKTIVEISLVDPVNFMGRRLSTAAKLKFPNKIYIGVSAHLDGEYIVFKKDEVEQLRIHAARVGFFKLADEVADGNDDKPAKKNTTRKPAARKPSKRVSKTKAPAASTGEQEAEAVHSGQVEAQDSTSRTEIGKDVRPGTLCLD